jgi:hypothetical protein
VCVLNRAAVGRRVNLSDIFAARREIGGGGGKGAGKNINESFSISVSISIFLQLFTFFLRRLNIGLERASPCHQLHRILH